MKDWEKIRNKARDIASNVHADPALRDAMADDLIQLMGLMVGAVGDDIDDRGHDRDSRCMSREAVGQILVSSSERVVSNSVTTYGHGVDCWTCESGYHCADHEEEGWTEVDRRPANVKALPSACGRCGGDGIDPEDWFPAQGPSWNSMGEPPVYEPCRDCQFD